MTIKKFINENIDISNEVWEKAKNRVKKVKEVVSSKNGEVSFFKNQGSFSTKTVVRPKRKGEEFDIDINAVITNKIDSVEFYHLSKKINQTIVGEFGDKASQFGEKSKATQIIFNKEFHVDVVPLLFEGGEQYVFDTKTLTKIKSNPLKLTEAFNANSQKHPDNSLRDAVKLIKYMRNLKAIKGVPSIGIAIHYANANIKYSSYEENVIGLLEYFSNISGSVKNPFCKGEIIEMNYTAIEELKEEVAKLVNKLKKNDFTGLKKRFALLGASITSSAAVASTVAAKLGSGGLHVSSINNYK